jgi:hypothetical protein
MRGVAYESTREVLQGWGTRYTDCKTGDARMLNTRELLFSWAVCFGLERLFMAACDSEELLAATKLALPTMS